MLTRDRVAALLEVLENGVAPVERHARPSIHDENPERAGLPRDAEAHTAALGELYRVTGEIEQNLTQARGVADRLCGNIGCDEACDFQALGVCARREEFDNAFHKRRDRKTLVEDIEL